MQLVNLKSLSLPLCLPQFYMNKAECVQLFLGNQLVNLKTLALPLSSTIHMNETEMRAAISGKRSLCFARWKSLHKNLHLPLRT